MADISGSVHESVPETATEAAPGGRSATPMDVIEQFTCGKSAAPARNEDALFVGEHLVSIGAGATAKSETLWDGMRSGRFASRVLARSLAGLAGDATLDAAVDYLTAVLRAEYAARNLVDAVTREPVLRPTAAIAMFSRARHESGGSAIARSGRRPVAGRQVGR
jgi:hypothetical protein